MKHRNGVVSVVALMGLSMVGCAERSDFTLRTLGDKSVSLSAHRGDVVLVSFFALG